MVGTSNLGSWGGQWDSQCDVWENHEKSCGSLSEIYKKNIYKPPKGWFSTLSPMGLVGGLEHEWNEYIMTFHSVGNFIIPTDFH